MPRDMAPSSQGREPPQIPVGFNGVPRFPRRTTFTSRSSRGVGTGPTCHSVQSAPCLRPAAGDLRWELPQLELVPSSFSTCGCSAPARSAHFGTHWLRSQASSTKRVPRANETPARICDAAREARHLQCIGMSAVRQCAAGSTLVAVKGPSDETVLVTGGWCQSRSCLGLKQS